MFRQRASRLAKWREVAQQAAENHSVKVNAPDAIEFLGSASEYIFFICFHLHVFSLGVGDLEY